MPWICATVLAMPHGSALEACLALSGIGDCLQSGYAWEPLFLTADECSERGLKECARCGIITAPVFGQFSDKDITGLQDLVCLACKDGWVLENGIGETRSSA